MVRVDADVGGDVQGFFGDVSCRQVRILHEGPRRGQGVVAARADGRDAVIRFDDLAVAGNEEDTLSVGDEQQRFQLVQDFVGTPIFSRCIR